MRVVIVTFCLHFIFFPNAISQVTIVSDDFENTFSLFTSSGTGSFYTGNSSITDRPANSSFSFSNSYGFGVLNNQATLTSSSIDVSTYTSIELNLKIAAFSVGDANNGLDNGDFIQVSVSPDGGANYYQTVQVRGFTNSYWSYTGGTATASAAYDGDLNVASFAPTGSGERTTDGYSTLRITNLPQVTNLRIRIFILNSVVSELWVIDNFEIKGVPVTGPLINIFPFSLLGFSSITGNASAEQTFSVRGLNLTDNITINAPTGFQISQSSGSGFGSAITLNQSSGSVPWSIIYVRMNSATLGSNSGSISNSSSGALTKNVSVSGRVFATEPTVPSTISFSNITGESMTINFSGGNGAGRLVVMQLSNPVTAAPTDGFSYTASNTFGGASVIGSDQYVVYSGTGNSVTVIGLAPSSTYHVAVFEFNDGGVTAARNYLATAGIGNATTSALNAGLELTATNSIFQIDFDNTVPRVNNGSFAGIDIVPSPLPGQLNSNAWSINSVNFGGASVFGSTISSGGGVSTGNVSSSTFYAFEISPGNKAVGVQPGNTNWNEGNITLRVQNNTGNTITSLAVAYKVYVLNNTNGANYFAFGYATDNLSYGMVSSDTLLDAMEVSPTWKSYLRSTMITGLSIPSNGIIYLRWGLYNYFGSIESDEIAWDDIRMVANPTTVFPRVAGNFQNIYTAGNIELEGNVTVAGNVTVDAATINLGNYDLSIGGNSNSLSSGYLRTNGTGAVTLNNVTTARLLPIGVSTYNPVTISNGSGLNWTARIDDGISNVLPPSTTERAVLRTWTITPSTNPPPAAATLTFQYDDGDASQLGTNFNYTEDVQIWHYSVATGWTTASNALTPTGTPGGIRTVTLNNWSQFSSFAIANLSGPLPVKFGPLKAFKTVDGIRVKWTNYTESNIRYYYVERSADARNFNAFATVNPVFNNGNSADYSSLDALPLRGNNFYRIAVLETNGNVVYSNVVRVNLEKSIPGITVFPNPVGSGQAYLHLTDVPKGNFELKIVSSNAQLIARRLLSHDGGSLIVSLSEENLLTPGFYVVQLYNKDISLQTRFIVK